MFDSAMRQLRDGLAAARSAVADIDVMAADAATARELVVLGERLERLGRGMKLSATARVAEVGAWNGDGDRTVADWLARTTGTSKQEAERAVTTGKQLAALPDTSKALAEGRVSARQAEAIAGAAAADPSAERGLLAEAGRMGLRDLQSRCRDTRAKADPDPHATSARIHAQRSYRTWTDAEGVGHLHASGPAATIARVDAAIRHRADRIFRDAHRAGRREPSEAYAFDALEQAVVRDGDGTVVPRGADAKVIVRIDEPALARGHAIDGEVCEIAGVGPIPVSVAREWMDNAFVAAVLTRGTEITKVVHLGRRFTSEQRTVLQWQDATCARRSCGRSLGLEYDHLEDWARTRTTRTTSAKRWCRACHRLKSAGWTVGPPDANGKHDLLPPAGSGRTIGDDERDVDEQLADAVARARRVREAGELVGAAPLFDSG
jgi:hypothetical protein